MTAAFEESKRLGVKYITGSPQGEVQSLIFEDGDVKGANTADGKEHRADRTILAVGASAERFLDFENQIRPTAWTIGHIQMTPEETQLYKNVPVLFNIGKGFFMEPDEDLHQLKMCDEHPGYVNWVQKPGAKFPRSIPFAKHQVPLEHFLITYHPRHPSLVVASGDRGIGYKHITSIGNFISDCMENTLEERFAKVWRWRPEKFIEFWGKDSLERLGADHSIMDLPRSEDEGWTDISESDLIL
ncbi:hypothetical protein ACHAQC_011329 [Fusarium culmorum]